MEVDLGKSSSFAFITKVTSEMMFMLYQWQGQGTGVNAAQVIQLGDISIVFLLISQSTGFELALAFRFLQKDLRVEGGTGSSKVPTPF